MRFFTIQVHGGDEDAADLNRFMATHRILGAERHLVLDGANSTWAFCVSFEPSGARPAAAGKCGKVDFKDVLGVAELPCSPGCGRCASRWPMPAYALFTNDQLAEMVQRRVVTIASLREIPGVGDSRVQKYFGRGGHDAKFSHLRPQTTNDSRSVFSRARPASCPHGPCRAGTRPLAHLRHLCMSRGKGRARCRASGRRTCAAPRVACSDRCAFLFR
jgi:HRDC domain